jgi:hypothetical protein
LIRPADKEITADMWNYNYNQMITAINQLITLNPVGVAENASQLDRVSVFPVPATDELTIDLSGSELGIDNLVITDATGRVVGHVTVGGDTQVKVDVAAYQAGVYLVDLRAKGVSLGTERFVK